MASLILDGYTSDETIKGRGPFPAVHFKFRPAVSDETNEYQFAVRNAGNAKEAVKPLHKILVDHIKEWDVKNGKGEDMPISVATLKLLPMYVLERMSNFVMGYGYADSEEDQKNSPEESS